MNNNMNMIKGKKIDELKDYLNEKKELIFHYEKYIEKTIEIFKNLLNELNSIHSSLKLDDNNKLNNLINKFPLNIKNLNIEDISDVLNNGLKIKWITRKILIKKIMGNYLMIMKLN